MKRTTENLGVIAKSQDERDSDVDGLLTELTTY